jgi:hypothetical protein
MATCTRGGASAHWRPDYRCVLPGPGRSHKRLAFAAPGNGSASTESDADAQEDPKDQAGQADPGQPAAAVGERPMVRRPA